jgi:transcriptional regulator with XRE-family HTH domain
MSYLHEKIKRLLSEKGMTQNELCEKLEISPNGFKKMMDKGSVKSSTLENLAKILDVSIEFLLDEKQQKTNDKTIEALERYIDELKRDKSYLQNIIENQLAIMRNIGMGKPKSFDVLPNFAA